MSQALDAGAARFSDGELAAVDAVSGARRRCGPGVRARGLLGDGIARLDEANTAAVVTAVATLVEGRYIEPDPAEPPASVRWGHPELVGRLPGGTDRVDLEDDRVSLPGDSSHDEPPAGDDAGHGSRPPV